MLLIWNSLLLVTYLTFIMTKRDIIIIPILWVEKPRYRDIKWLITMTPKQNYQFNLKISTNKIQISCRVCFTDVLLKVNHCWQHKYSSDFSGFGAGSFKLGISCTMWGFESPFTFLFQKYCEATNKPFF